METYVMPIALQSNDFYLLSTAHWLLKQYDQAISALTGTGEDEDDVSRETPAPVSTKISTMRSSLYPSSSPLSSSAASSSKLDSSSLSRCSTPSTVTSRTSASAAESDGKKKVAFDPSAVHLFNYMRERPFLPQRYACYCTSLPVPCLSKLMFMFISEPSEKEERMLRRAIYAYARAGCSGLALELVCKFGVQEVKAIDGSENLAVTFFEAHNGGSECKAERREKTKGWGGPCSQRSVWRNDDSVRPVRRNDDSVRPVRRNDDSVRPVRRNDDSVRPVWRNDDSVRPVWRNDGIKWGRSVRRSCKQRWRW